MGRRSRRRIDTTASALFFGALAAFLMAYGCAEEGEEIPEFLCNPGENIFCRCPGGDPGTKRCLDSGQAFEECEPCEPRPTTGPAQQSSSGVGAGGPGAGGPGAGGPGAGGPGGFGAGGAGAGGGGLGDQPLLAPCDGNGDCQSGLCIFNYCTQVCALVSECPYPQSECVPFDASTTLCMPTCATALDCAPFDAPPSQCGFAQAVDNWDVTVCAEWGGNHQLMPAGTDCLPFDHPACNLGYQQQQAVCTEQGICAQGCYVNNDCPQGTTCNGGGSLGNCQ
jgi:hypothetical protein